MTTEMAIQAVTAIGHVAVVRSFVRQVIRQVIRLSSVSGCLLLGVD